MVTLTFFSNVNMSSWLTRCSCRCFFINLWDISNCALAKELTNILCRPTGGIAALILFFFLNLNPKPHKSLKVHVREFDFIGLGLIIAGVVCLLIGFNSSETKCKAHYAGCCVGLNHVDYAGDDAETISLITIGGVLLLVAGVYEIFTTKSAILPARLFKVGIFFSKAYALYLSFFRQTRTTSIVLVSVFLHAICFFQG